MEWLWFSVLDGNNDNNHQHPEIVSGVSKIGPRIDPVALAACCHGHMVVTSTNRTVRHLFDWLILKRDVLGRNLHGRHGSRADAFTDGGPK